MNCPHCGRPISVGVMCADCADRISTDQIFEGLTFGGRLPDCAIALIPTVLYLLVVLVMIVLLFAGV
jgi:hypothetical protein